ncbi:MAG: oligosaccharide flippase family protein [Ignavibacteria bacterium]|nr:oligosaccharide flippase family protein [Ignavibacteria bacterium]
MLTKTDKKNALWNSVGFVGVALLGFVNFSLNYATYPSGVFGLFILLNAIFGIGNSLDFGFGVSTVKLLSEAKKQEDYLTLNKIFVSYFFSYIILGVIILSGFWVYFLLFLKNSELISKAGFSSVLIIYSFLSVSFLFRYINNYLNRVYEGFAEFILFSKISISVSLFNTVLMLALFFLKYGLEYLAFIYMLSGIVNFIVLLAFSVKRIKVINLNLKYFSLGLIKKYAVYSINIQVSFFVNGLIDPLIKYFIGSYISISFVTYFESAKKIIDLSNGLIFSAQKGLLNKLSEHNVSNTLTEYLNSEIHIYSRMSNYYSIFIYGIMNTSICTFIYFWFRSYEGMLMFLIFIMPYSLINFAGCLYLVLMVEGKGKKLLSLQIINFVFLLGLLFVSLNLFNNYFGLFGFYIATLITIILVFYFLSKYNGFHVKVFLGKIVLSDLIKLNILIFTEILMLYTFKDQFGYVMAAFTIVYIAIFYKFVKYFVKMILEKYKIIFSYF